jgi:glutamine cyclotransferase
VQVFDEMGPVDKINELEYIDGKVYANIWGKRKIAIINPKTGKAEKWIDFKGILPKEKYPRTDVMNGIAYEPSTNKLYVTGKLWPFVFDVKITRSDNKTN